MHAFWAGKSLCQGTCLLHIDGAKGGTVPVRLSGVPIGVLVLWLASGGPAMRLLRILHSPKVQCHGVWDHAPRWLTLKAVTCCTVTARLSLVPATLSALWLTRSSRAISPSACALSMFSLYSTKRQYLAAESAGQPPLSALRSPACPFSPLLRLFCCR